MTIDDELDTLYEKVDTLLCDGEFEAVDEMLKNTDPNAHCNTYNIGMLMITFAAKSHLKHRQDFYDKAAQAAIRKLFGGLK